MSCVVAFICNPRAGEVETGGSLGLSDQGTRPVRDPVPKKVDDAQGMTARLSSGLHTDVYTCPHALVHTKTKTEHQLVLENVQQMVSR